MRDENLNQDPISASDLSEEELIRMGEAARARKQTERVDNLLAGIVALEKDFKVAIVPVPQLPRQQPGMGQVVVLAGFATLPFEDIPALRDGGPTIMANALAERMAARTKEGTTDGP